MFDLNDNLCKYIYTLPYLELGNDILGELSNIVFNDYIQRQVCHFNAA